jgi:hypothetical protein
MPLPAPCGDVAAVLDRKKLMMMARHLVDCEHVRVGAVRIVDLVGVARRDEVMALSMPMPRRARPDGVRVVRAEYARADRERAVLLERRAFAKLDLSHGKPPALRRPLPDVDGDVERVVVRPPPVAFVHASNVKSASSTTPDMAKLALPCVFSFKVFVIDLVPEWMCDGIWPTLIFLEPPVAPAEA